jgi:hypothetical protein
MKTESETLLKQPEFKSVTASKKNYEILWKIVFLFITVVSAVLINKIYLYQTLPYFENIRKGYISELVYFGIPFGILFILYDTLFHQFFDEKC